MQLSMFKNIALAGSALIFSTQSFASHYFSCDVKARVLSTQNLARLDGVAIFGAGINDVDQIVELEILEVSNQGGHGGCFTVGIKQTLSVKKDQIGKYVKDQVIDLSYRNRGDFKGSQISWLVK